MPLYSIVFTKTAQKELKRISQKDQNRIVEKIAKLAREPRPTGCKKLSNDEKYRIRQGNYRILYEIKDQTLVIVVVKLGHRRSVYE